MKNTKQTAVTTKEQLTYSDDQIALIKRTIAPDATDDELKLLMYQSTRTGLDLLSRQMYFFKMSGKVVIQTSIDGFRVVAQRSNEYAGQDEPEFEEGKPYPVKCKVTVYKFGPNGVRYPAAVGVAYWSEYVKEFNGRVGTMWAKMPHTMLSKVAEALALRKAFPQDLSGIYTDEEMSQAEPVKEAEANRVTEGKVVTEKPKYSISYPQQKKIFALLAEKGFSKERLDHYIANSPRIKKTSLTELTVDEAGIVIETLEAMPNKEEIIDADEVDAGIEQMRMEEK